MKRRTFLDALLIGGGIALGTSLGWLTSGNFVPFQRGSKTEPPAEPAFHGSDKLGYQWINIFSSSGLAKKEVGDVADFSAAYPEFFSKGGPTVIEKYLVKAPGFRAYKAESGLNHNILGVRGDETSGAVLKLEDTVDNLMSWYFELERFEAHYGMISELRDFPIIGSDQTVRAKIYFIKHHDDLKNDRFILRKGEIGADKK
ncbi:hypothetical protein KY348_04490 [Candidatus Woesearchaeota archaeon]|nr:hypothetical protein [Candidatus Woesearchaeota archaeon]